MSDGPIALAECVYVFSAASDCVSEHLVVSFCFQLVCMLSPGYVMVLSVPQSFLISRG